MQILELDIESNAWSPLLVSKMITGPEQLIRRQKNDKTLAGNQLIGWNPAGLYKRKD